MKNTGIDFFGQIYHFNLDPSALIMEFLPAVHPDGD